MAEFFDLRRERAAAALVDPRDQRARDAPGRRQGEPAPFNRGVMLRILRIEQVAILDKKQAVDDERRDIGKVAVCRVGKPGAINFIAEAIENAEPGAIFFPVDRE